MAQKNFWALEHFLGVGVILRCVHTDSNLVIQLCTTRLCDIKRVVNMQKVVVQPTSTLPRFFFINLAQLQRQKWRKYVQITSDSIQHLCETIMSHEFLLKWTDIWRFTILVAQPKMSHDTRRPYHSHYHDTFYIARPCCDTFYVARPCCTKSYD